MRCDHIGFINVLRGLRSESILSLALSLVSKVTTCKQPVAERDASEVWGCGGRSFNSSAVTQAALLPLLPSHFTLLGYRGNSRTKASAYSLACLELHILCPTLYTHTHTAFPDSNNKTLTKCLSMLGVCVCVCVRSGCRVTRGQFLIVVYFCVRAVCVLVICVFVFSQTVIWWETLLTLTCENKQKSLFSLFTSSEYGGPKLPT